MSAVTDNLPAKTPIFVCADGESAMSLKELIPDINVMPISSSNDAIIQMSVHTAHLIPDNTPESRMEMAKLAALLVNNFGQAVHQMDMAGFAANWRLVDAGLTDEQFRQLAFRRLEPNVIPITREKRIKGPKLGGASEEVEQLWRTYGLEMSHSKTPYENIDNALRSMVAANIEIWYDEFLQRPMCAWNCDLRELRDSDYVDITVWLQRDVQLRKMSLRNVTAATDAYIRQNVRNCAREWMLSLAWDNTARLDSLAVDGFGTVDDSYHRAVLRCFLLGMVKRVLEPGCQVDTMPVFEGPEGIRKSTALRILGGEWFAECHEEITGKDFLQIMPGKMLLEVSELYSFKRADIERIKGIITNRVDRYRASYGRLAGDHPRMCVLAGSTNRDDYNASDTGARRLLPVVCGIIDLDWLRINRDQLFAEAVSRIKAGENHWEVPVDDAKNAVNARRNLDAWDNAIIKWAEAKREVSLDEVLRDCLLIELNRVTNQDANRVRSVLRSAGWTQFVTTRDKHSVRLWQPPSYAAKLLAEIDKPSFDSTTPF